jgi:hypothetical protein
MCAAISIRKLGRRLNMKKAMPQFAFDRLFFRRFWTLLRVLYPSFRMTAVWMSICVLIVSVLRKIFGFLPNSFFQNKCSPIMSAWCRRSFT